MEITNEFGSKHYLSYKLVCKMMQKTLRKIKQTAISDQRRPSVMRLSIVGSGVVGQATGMGFAVHNHKVLFHDIDKKKLLDAKR